MQNKTTYRFAIEGETVTRTTSFHDIPFILPTMGDLKTEYQSSLEHVEDQWADYEQDSDPNIDRSVFAFHHYKPTFDQVSIAKMQIADIDYDEETGEYIVIHLITYSIMLDAYYFDQAFQPFNDSII